MRITHRLPNGGLLCFGRIPWNYFQCSLKGNDRRSFELGNFEKTEKKFTKYQVKNLCQIWVISPKLSENPLRGPSPATIHSLKISVQANTSLSENQNGFSINTFTY
jgi:hypothetical protein